MSDAKWISERKDSGHSAADDSEPKLRDFALDGRKAGVSVTAGAKNTPRKAAASTCGPTVAIKADKQQGSCWRRVKVTALSRLAGKA